MFKLSEIISPSHLWPNAEDREDLGPVQGFVRGYNVEVINENAIEWLPATWIHGLLDDELNNKFYTDYYASKGFAPTGRVSFRGYGMVQYDNAIDENFVRLCSIDEVKAAMVFNDNDVEEMFAPDI